MNKPVEHGPPLTSLGGQAAVRVAIIFLAVVAAGALVRIFREILAPLVVATFLLLLIDALSRDLDDRLPKLPRLARAIGSAVLIVAGFAALIVLIVFQGPPFAIEMRGVAPRLNLLIATLTHMLGQASFTLHDMFGRSDPSAEFGHIFAAARGAITFAGLVMIFLGFLLASRAAFSSKLDRLYDTQHHREQARRVFNSIRNAVEDYVRLVTFKALLIAIIAFGVMLALGVESALFVAFLVFLSAFVPIVGAFAGAVIPALVALAQFGDITKPAILLGGLGVADFVIDNILMPKLQGDELNIDPLLVLVSIGVWGLLLGPTGALLSTPLTVTVMAVAAEFDGARWLAVLIS
ncbi:MAG TPA: AI-2E family transporter, partial [Caulobacteraceae bacterium]|nr:AI-2E family transporter [Caulobacteraceae bacterium]